MLKTCIRCNKSLSKKEFRYVGRNKYNKSCKDCLKIVHRRKQGQPLDGLNKRCPTCEKVKPRNSSFWNKNRTRYDGLCAECKMCQQTNNRKRRYGVGQEEFKGLISKQENRCPICGGELTKGHGTNIDHNHQNGEVRGVLCHNCNSKLGWYEKYKAVVTNYLRGS